MLTQPQRLDCKATWVLDVTILALSFFWGGEECLFKVMSYCIRETGLNPPASALLVSRHELHGCVSLRSEPSFLYLLKAPPLFFSFDLNPCTLNSYLTQNVLAMNSMDTVFPLWLVLIDLVMDSA